LQDNLIKGQIPIAPVFDRVVDYIATGSVVLHVGASFGYYTVFFADRVGPEGLVVAFEPQTAMYQVAYLSIYHKSSGLSIYLSCIRQVAYPTPM
jgi:predicted O-methyltransferase YrrM